MTWSSFYLICFGVGFTLSLISFISGTHHLHLPTHVHAGHVGHVGHAVANAGAAVRGAASAAGKASHRIGWFNSAAFLVFLAWFGGVGYLLTTHYRVWYLTALGFSTAAGFAGAGAISWFMVDVLQKHDTALDEADYRMEGMVGRIGTPIRAKGTGEVIFVQEGVRRVCGARSEDGTALERDAEVVITRYEKGIAYVKRWEEFTK